MGFKSILICLNEVRRLDELVEAAVTLGHAFDAHITGLFVIPAAPFYVSLGVKAISEAFESQHRYFAENAKKVQQAFEDAMQEQGVSHEFVLLNSSNARIWDEVVDHGVSSDLIVLASSRRDIEKSVEDYLGEETVMRSGRPVLILPYEGLRTLSIDTIIVGWNGKRESARAAFDALPLLQQAKDVRVVSISKPDEEEAGPPAGVQRLLRTLARHRIIARAESITGDGKFAGRLLMAHAAEVGAGLTVMGAYGHARNREYVFGGATFEMLLHMNRPVLMSN